MQNYNTNMPLKIISSTKITLFFSFFLNHFFKTPKSKNVDDDEISSTHFEFREFRILGRKPDLEDRVLVFDVEKSLLRSSSLFPYFMLVAFEAGSPIRSLVLLLLYPFIYLFSEGFAVKAMVMVCFLGLKSERFTEGKAVLPKFFLEDVGAESFEVFRRAKKKVAVSNLPLVMVESFLKDYLDIDLVVGRDLKVFHGYFLGLLEERREILLDDGITSDAIGVSSSKEPLRHRLLSSCKVKTLIEFISIYFQITQSLDVFYNGEKLCLLIYCRRYI